MKVSLLYGWFNVSSILVTAVEFVKSLVINSKEYLSNKITAEFLPAFIAKEFESLWYALNICDLLFTILVSWLPFCYTSTYCDESILILVYWLIQEALNEKFLNYIIY